MGGDVRHGGPTLNTVKVMLSGRVDRIMSNSFAAFTYAREGARRV